MGEVKVKEGLARWSMDLQRYRSCSLVAIHEIKVLESLFKQMGIKGKNRETSYSQKTFKIFLKTKLQQICLKLHITETITFDACLLKIA